MRWVVKSHYEHHYMKPRPRDAAGELAQSRYEQRIDMETVGGLAGIREIRARIAAMSSLKARLGDRPATLAEMDEVLAPVPCARTRLHLESRPEPEPPLPTRMRMPPTLAERAKQRERCRRRRSALAQGVLCEARAREILDALAGDFGPGDVVLCRDICAKVQITKSTASWYVRGLRARGEWPYRAAAKRGREIHFKGRVDR